MPTQQKMNEARLGDWRLLSEDRDPASRVSLDRLVLSLSAEGGVDGDGEGHLVIEIDLDFDAGDPDLDLDRLDCDAA